MNEISKTVRVELNHHIETVLEICRMHKIPHFISTAVEDSEEGTVYETHMYGPKSHNVTLTDDRITQHMLIANGFQAVPSRNIVSVDMGELYGTDE